MGRYLIYAFGLLSWTHFFLEGGGGEDHDNKEVDNGYDPEGIKRKERRGGEDFQENKNRAHSLTSGADLVFVFWFLFWDNTLVDSP